MQTHLKPPVPFVVSDGGIVSAAGPLQARVMVVVILATGFEVCCRVGLGVLSPYRCGVMVVTVAMVGGC
jgi:hypothetical protein